MVLIHTVVHQAANVFHKWGKYQRWGPSMCGLALIPLLPLIDEPVEELIDHAFEVLREQVDGTKPEPHGTSKGGGGAEGGGGKGAKQA
jgi:hypothetical protein